MRTTIGSHGRPGGDVADGRELGRPREREQAHRARFDGRVAGALGGQAEDEAEARAADTAIPAVSSRSCRRAARRSRVTRVGVVNGAGPRAGARLAQEVLGAGPVADDVDGVLLAGVARRVEQARAARGGALVDPPALVLVERRDVSALSLSARPSRPSTSAATRAARSASVSLL